MKLICPHCKRVVDCEYELSGSIPGGIRPVDLDYRGDTIADKFEGTCPECKAEFILEEVYKFSHFVTYQDWSVDGDRTSYTHDELIGKISRKEE